MRYILLLLVFSNFTPVQTKNEIDDIDFLMHKIKHKAEEGTLDKQRIKQWLYEQQNGSI